jgi:glyoxylase-like metal-dependent hydrolase (beta-lactamase superfamily II)
VTRPALQIDLVEGDVMAVNSYLVHGPTGVVVVDGQLTVSDAAKVCAAVDAAGAPLVGVLVTHAHPDHYAGIAHLLGGADVPIVATARVTEAIRRDDEVKNSIVGPMMGAEWPEHRVFPNRLPDADSAIELGGVEFRVLELGPGESPADTIWFVDERTVFAGDVAYHGAHSYLADGYAAEWLANISRLEAELAPEATLYVGHGEPAGKDLLAAQRAYIEAFITAVEEHLDDDDHTRQTAVAAEMVRHLPTDRLRFLMELSVSPFAAATRSRPRR